jgi:hypothetical protein
MARGEHPSDRSLPRRSLALHRRAPLRELRALGAQAAALDRGLREGAVCLRDGALRFAQRVARLAAAAFLAIQRLLQRFDPNAQRLEIGLPRLPWRAERREAQRGEEKADQALAFPCAATEAMRFSISAASPR